MTSAAEEGAKQGFARIDALVQRYRGQTWFTLTQESTMNPTTFTTANELEIRVGRVSTRRARDDRGN